MILDVGSGTLVCAALMIALASQTSGDAWIDDPQTGTLGNWIPYYDAVLNPPQSNGRIVTSIEIEEANVYLIVRAKNPSKIDEQPWRVTLFRRDVPQGFLGSEDAAILRAGESIYLPFIGASSRKDAIELLVEGPAPSLLLRAIEVQMPSYDEFWQVNAFRPRYFDSGFSTDRIHREQASAIAIYWFYTRGSQRQLCTAFRFFENYYLTNQHCIVSDERPDGFATGGNKLELGVTDSYPSGSMRIPAELVYVPSDRRLDYAILRVSETSTFDNFILRLNVSSDLKLQPNGDQLEMYTHWRQAQSFVPISKVLIDDSDCKVIDKPSYRDKCPTPYIMHGCDSDEGSSGSPILIRGSQLVVALHNAGIAKHSANCALPVSAILADMALHPETRPIYEALMSESGN